MKATYPSKAAAEADLMAAGFKSSGDYWTKPSMTHGWEPHPTVALVEIVEHKVDAKWNQPNYFEPRFY